LIEGVYIRIVSKIQLESLRFSAYSRIIIVRDVRTINSIFI